MKLSVKINEVEYIAEGDGVAFTCFMDKVQAVVEMYTATISSTGQLTQEAVIESVVLRSSDVIVINVTN